MEHDLEAWKAKFPRHWWALEHMHPGHLQRTLRAMLRTRGVLGTVEMEVLWHRAEQIERAARGHLILPTAGTRICVAGVYLRARTYDDGKITMRFKSEGRDTDWIGLADVRARPAFRSKDLIWVEGKVRWVIDGVVRLEDDPRVESRAV